MTRLVVFALTLLGCSASASDPAPAAAPALGPAGVLTQPSRADRVVKTAAEWKSSLTPAAPWTPMATS